MDTAAIKGNNTRPVRSDSRIDRTLFGKWISQLHLHFAQQTTSHKRSVHVARLVNSLLFVSNGRVLRNSAARRKRFIRP